MRTHRDLFTRSAGLLALVFSLSVVAAACGSDSVSGSASPSASTSPSESATASGSPSPTETTPPPTTGIVRGSDGWSTYTNAEIGFTFRFPTRIHTDNARPCTKDTSGADWTYRWADGVVRATVIADGDTFYVEPVYSYQLGDLVEKASGSYYKSCPRIETTLRTTRTYWDPATTGTDWVLTSLPIFVHEARNVTAATQALQDHYYGCDTLEVTKVGKKSPDGWRRIEFRCASDELYFNSREEARYYAADDLLVVFSLGQAVQVYDASQSPADDAILASFTPLS